MSKNKEFIELYEQTRQNHSKLHHWEIDGLKVWFVEGSGRRQTWNITDCRDFADMTVKGCVVVTHDHSVWLKVNTQQWINPTTNKDILIHDLDIVKLLVAESDTGKVATIIDPGE